MPVIRFEAIHEGVEQGEGLLLGDSSFRGLPASLELAVEARVILIMNLAVELGLMNGSQGVINAIIYPLAPVLFTMRSGSACPPP